MHGCFLFLVLKAQEKWWVSFLMKLDRPQSLFHLYLKNFTAQLD